jgi:Na+-transporting NADH:ubiquinone oxidoreductase subunit NqrE
MAKIVKEFTKGLWTDLPPFRLVLGLCPVLAVTKSAGDGLGMGAAVIFVLTLSNLIISSVRKLIPKKVRIACFIAIAASLVVSVEMLMQAFSYPLYQSLGIFVPLIVVNCIILGRAEAFAAKNPVHLAVADGLGMGIGFHALPDFSRRPARALRCRDALRKPGDVGRLSAFPFHDRGARGLRLARPHPGCDEPSHRRAGQAPGQGPARKLQPGVHGLSGLQDGHGRHGDRQQVAGAGEWISFCCSSLRSS